MRVLPAVALLILVIASIALALAPNFLVSALRSQTADDLELSYALASWAPALNVVCEP